MTDALEIANGWLNLASGAVQPEVAVSTENLHAVATALIEAIKERDEARGETAEFLRKAYDHAGKQVENQAEALDRLRRIVASHEALTDNLAQARSRVESLTMALEVSDRVLRGCIASAGDPLYISIKQAIEANTAALSPQPSQESERVPCGNADHHDGGWANSTHNGPNATCDGFAPTQSQEGGAG